jgi:hypothetical protein
MATALTIVNAVLRRLREAQVTDFSSAYATLILDFVNETKRECEDAWRWTDLRQTLTLNTISGTQTYAIPTASGGSSRRWQFSDPQNRIFDATNKSYIYPIQAAMLEEYKWTTTTTNAQPTHYSVQGSSTNGIANIDLWPTPDGVYVLKIPMYAPQADFTITTENLIIPELPVILGTWARAISERGEDQGFKTSDQYVLYQNSLAYHIGVDVARVPHETDWNPL